MRTAHPVTKKDSKQIISDDKNWDTCIGVVTGSGGGGGGGGGREGGEVAISSYGPYLNQISILKTIIEGWGEGASKGELRAKILASCFLSVICIGLPGVVMPKVAYQS